MRGACPNSTLHSRQGYVLAGALGNGGAFACSRFQPQVTRRSQTPQTGDGGEEDRSDRPGTAHPGSGRGRPRKYFRLTDTGAANTFFWIDPDADLIGMVWTQIEPFGIYDIEREFQTLVYESLE